MDSLFIAEVPVHLSWGSFREACRYCDASLTERTKWLPLNAGEAVSRISAHPILLGKEREGEPRVVCVAASLIRFGQKVVAAVITGTDHQITEANHAALGSVFKRYARSGPQRLGQKS